MKHEQKKDLVSELTGLLKQIYEGKNQQALRKEANRLISCIHPHDITHAESRLVKSGLSAQKVRQLSATFILMGVLEGQKDELVKQLPDGHLLRKVLAEHEMLRCFLADLEDVTEQISLLKSLSDTSREFMRLTHILEHLNAMDEHLDRENDVIFPALKNLGWESLCRSVENDHVYLRMAIDDLIKLVLNFRNTSFNIFRRHLSSLTKYLCPALKEHLFHEDHILFPLALEMIDDTKVWNRLKNICDEIDYCGIHL